MSQRDRRTWRWTSGEDPPTNPDRHVKTEERKAKKAETQREYAQQARSRRGNHGGQAVCTACWRMKTVDGSDGEGGFSPCNYTASGWMNTCRRCAAARKQEWRKRQKESDVQD